MRHGDAAEGDQRRLRRQTRCVATPGTVNLRAFGWDGSVEGTREFSGQAWSLYSHTAGVLRPQELRAVFKHFPKTKAF